MSICPTRTLSILPNGTVLLVLIFLTGCLLTSNDCPKIDNTIDDEAKKYPVCTGSVGYKNTSEVPELPKFGRAASATGSKTSLTRVTNNSSNNQDTKRRQHFYSRRQAWNLDETLLDLGSAIVNADTYDVDLEPPPFSSERIWSNQNKDSMIGIRYNPKPIELSWYNFQSQKYEQTFRFEQYEKCTLGHGEGNLSNDDKQLVTTCTDKDGNTDIISLDLDNKKILGVMRAESNINWASISPSGNYVIVENNDHPDPNPVLLRYSKYLKDEVLLMEHPSHGDLTLDDHGNDIHVMIGSNSVFYIRIKDRQQVKLGIDDRQNKLGSGHISCRNLKRPGWCYLSSYLSGHVGAFKIGAEESNESDLVDLRAWKKQGPNAYEHWGFHHSSSSDYQAQAKASASPSGTKVIFSSDWGQESPVEDYIFAIE